MITSPQSLLNLAGKFMPRRRTEWLTAMQAELSIIEDPRARLNFAFGCLKSAALEAAQSRKGLSYIARCGGAAISIGFSIFGVVFAAQYSANPDGELIAKMIIGLCLSYGFGALLLLTSLQALRKFAGAGFILTVVAWIYCMTQSNTLAYLQIDFLTALSLEAAAIMAGFFIAATYLRWLYNPEFHDA